MENWLYEYYKYLIIKAKIKDKAFPSRIVRCVINTHMEIVKEYRLFNTKHQFNHTRLGENESKILTDYEETLKVYKEMFNMDPSPPYWPPAQSFQNEKFEKDITVNSLRLVV